MCRREKEKEEVEGMGIASERVERICDLNES